MPLLVWSDPELTEAGESFCGLHQCGSCWDFGPADKQRTAAPCRAHRRVQHAHGLQLIGLSAEMLGLDAQPLESAGEQGHFPEGIWTFSMVARCSCLFSLTADEASV